MVASALTVAFSGIEVTPVDVQVQLSSGIPCFTVVGLPDKAVAESRERVRAAIHALGLSLPAKRIVVNLAPADLLKEGSHFDLPIALALLAAMTVIPAEELQENLSLGELSLNGDLLPVAGVLPAAIGAAVRGVGLICPKACGPEAAWAGDIPILAPVSLLELINHFRGIQILSRPECEPAPPPAHGPDMKDVRGQHMARRALEIAAAGAHNLLFTGPPGTGKSLLASCLPGILPPLSPRDMLEVSMLMSVAGKLTGGRLSERRPFRDPHHSSSMAAMVGGGRRALPGEISLAHLGVLFLDELPEFQRPVLEALRQPLETGTVTVARANAHLTYPSRFQLIAAMNPCRCGYLGDPLRGCGKAPKCGAEYQGKLSGPLLDRIDLHCDVPPVDTVNMLHSPEGEASAPIAARVAAARELQRERYAAMKIPFRTNAEAQGEWLTDSVALDKAGQNMLEDAARRFGLSMRGYTRVLRVARTVADLESVAAGASAPLPVRTHHLAEALSFRQAVYWKSGEMA